MCVCVQITYRLIVLVFDSDCYYSFIAAVLGRCIDRQSPHREERRCCSYSLQSHLQITDCTFPRFNYQTHLGWIHWACHRFGKEPSLPLPPHLISAELLPRLPIIYRCFLHLAQLALSSSYTPAELPRLYIPEAHAIPSRRP